jgi:hypothetical protein
MVSEQRGLEARIDDLARQLADVRMRLAALEQRRAEPSPSAPALALEGTDQPPPVEARGEATPAVAAPSTWVALAGRGLLVLGGAYLLRALTDEGLVPPSPGLALGLGYVAFWLLVADRRTEPERAAGSAVAGLVALAVAFPLVLESVVRFRILGELGGAGSVLALFWAGLLVARRRGLAVLAWLATLGALGASFGLLLGTRRLVLFTAVMLVIAARVEALAFRDRWLGLRWPTALAVDAALALALTLALREGGPPESYAPLSLRAVAGLGLLLPLLYLGGAALRTLLHGRAVAAFEVLQTPLALLLGLGGAARVLAAAGGSGAIVGIEGLLLGLGCYAAAFGAIERRAGQGLTFYTYTSLGAVLTLSGSALILQPLALAALWSLLAVAAAHAGVRHARATLRSHAVLFLAAAGAASGLLGGAGRALTAPAGGAPALGAGALLALAAMAAVYVLLARAGDSEPARVLPRLAAVAMLGFGLLGGVVGAIAGLLSAPADAGWLAAIRTAGISAAALALAAGARSPRRPELAWLAYAVLGLGALHLLADGLPHGRPATLMVAFVLYGGALLVVPRLLAARR